ncbi:hypothetical protein [Agromyces italicus]|uniref:hypothetical protein n=1 Tax=Agromyces italicus TaxID=279572 RepID=UPI0003B4151E|nr:hypothetical protein [Agromyces italicus]
MKVEDSDAGPAPRWRTSAAELRDQLVRTAFVTEESVYGVVLVSGMIVVAGAHGSSSWEVFWIVVITVVVFWAAHVYAGTVARHGLAVDHVMPLRQAFATALRHSLGLLASALLPSSILLLGATRVVPDALTIWLALWVGVVVLAALGFIAYRRRGAPWPMQLLGALTTAAFGLVMIVLKAVIH